MYPTKSASMAARRTGARMTNRMTPQGTAQISANAGKTQTRNTSLLLFALPNFLQLDGTNRPLSASAGGHPSVCPSQDDAHYSAR